MVEVDRSRAARPGSERSWAYRSAVATVRPLLMGLTKRDWRGFDRLPQEGGFLVAVNHISYVDPFAVAHALYDNGHFPHFLAKDTLFELRVFGPWLHAIGQVPVYRGTGRAMDAYRDAVTAIERGQCVTIMPESTITKDPLAWPMAGKTGAARIALQTRCPVVPLAQWGAQDLMARGSKSLKLFPRKTMHLIAGDPVDLADLYDKGQDLDAVREATRRIMTAITRQLEILRREQAPTGHWDPRLNRRVADTEPTGGVA